MRNVALGSSLALAAMLMSMAGGSAVAGAAAAAQPPSEDLLLLPLPLSKRTLVGSPLALLSVQSACIPPRSPPLAALRATGAL